MGHHPGELEQLVLFAVLRLQEDAYGVTIREQIEARTGRPVSTGGIYTILQRLEERGLVVSEIGVGSPDRGGKPRKRYALTPSGARTLETAYEALSSMADGVLGHLRGLARANGDE